jgi:ribosomal-protein-alanine N-acetyltransferase
MTLPLISPMQPEDVDTIMPLERLAFADPWSRRMYLSDLHENPLATYRVIRPAGGAALPPILGWGGFWLLVDEAHIATVAAHPEHRGCGLGELLMVDLMERAVERGARVATLEVRASNLIAQKLYAKLGFDVVGTRRKYYRDGEDGLIMTTPELDDPEIVARMGGAREDALTRIARCFGGAA